MHEVLNEGMFRQYLARVLFAENPNREETYQGEMTLTILTTHTPKTVLACKEYGFKKIHRWKYESRFFKDLEIYLLIQREMKDIQGGEGLALLQVLEGEEERQKILWDALYQQENLNIKLMEEIMHKINKETAMNLAEHYKIEGEKIGIEKGIEKGKIEGKIEELLEVLSWTAPELAKKYEKAIKEAKTEVALKKLKDKLKKEFAKKPLS